MRDVKTETLRFCPAADGWEIQNKKTSERRGELRFTVTDGTARVFLALSDEHDRAEAERFARRAVFRETDAKSAVLGARRVTRAEAEQEEAARLSNLHRTAADYRDVLGKPVTVVMDRPLGSRHPRHPEMLYTVNYGCVPGLFAGDGAEQDVYVLGPKEPLERFSGIVIAVIHRFDDVEDKWVAAERPGLFTAEEILSAVHFQEQFYESELILP